MANLGSNDMSVMLGNGDGTFRTQARSIVGQQPFRLTLADISGDGLLDLIVANRGDGSYVLGAVSIFPGRGDGTFGSATRITFSSSFTFTLGDFNRDGRLDLALFDFGGLLRLYAGQPGGYFSFQQDIGGFSNVNTVTVDDLDGDGNSDLILAKQRPEDLRVDLMVLLGNGDFSFRAKAPLRDGGSGFSDLVTGDVNGDAKRDLAVVNSSSGNVSVLAGNGDGTFSFLPRIATQGALRNIKTADFNEDQKPDLAGILDYSKVVLYLGDGEGNFTEQLGACPSNHFAIDSERPMCRLAA